MQDIKLSTTIECEFLGVARHPHGYWKLDFYKSVNGGTATYCSRPIYDASANVDATRIDVKARKPIGQEVLNTATNILCRELTPHEESQLLDLKYV